MVKFFNELYSSILDKNKFLKKIRFYSILRFLVRITANVIIPIYFKCSKKPYLDKTNNRNAPIVTLTSFPQRISRLWLVIETLMRQTKKPKEIILYLSREQFKTIDSVPRSLLKMRKRGLQIEIMDGNLRSHKKYIYAFSKTSKGCIITVDDDIFYPLNTIENLWKLHLNNNNCVCACYTRGIEWASNGQLKPYLEWNEISCYENLFFGSGGGVLFPPKSIEPKMLNASDILKICPTADDVWLNAMIRIKSHNVLNQNKENLIPLPVINYKNVTLSSVNNGMLQNDIQIEATRKYCLEKFGKDPFAKPSC